MSLTHLISLCPHCGDKLDMHGRLLDGSAPSPGDITLCVYCGGLCEFAENMTLKKPSEQTLMDIPEEEKIHLQMFKNFIMNRKLKERENNETDASGNVPRPN